MAENVIHLRTTRQALRSIIRQIPKACAGDTSVADAAVRGLMTRIGMSALGNIRQAFVVKARGGTDECGLSWPALAKSTVAYSRRHPGVLNPGSKRAPYAPSWMLTEKQRKRWWALYRAFGGSGASGSAYHARGTSHGWAAARAWAILKAEGAKTLMSEYGDTEVEILRDKGLLLNSLTPGTDSPDQVFRTGRGDVILGTSRAFAAAHHRGIPGKLPQRRLWPAPSTWTPQWWDSLLTEAKAGLLEITLFMVQRSMQ